MMIFVQTNKQGSVALLWRFSLGSIYLSIFSGLRTDLGYIQIPHPSLKMIGFSMEYI